MKSLLATRGILTLHALFCTALLSVTTFSATAQDCGCDFVIKPPESRASGLILDGDVMGVKPGQTICLDAGFYKQIRFLRFAGEPGNPVTIKNCGGKVIIGDSTDYGRWYAIDVVSARYVRLTGGADPRFRYGIKLGRSGDSALKIGASTDVEVDHLEIGNANFAGILAKSDYGGNPPPDAPEMNNLHIHNNYIHDVRGEGMYIGETKTPGQNFRHLEVWNNIVTRTGFDLFQVANVVEDVSVHHNVFVDAGTRNTLYQNKGFQIGDNSVGRYYNNFIINSPSNLMIVMGSGDIDVFNNYMDGAGDPGFFIDNRTVTNDATGIDIRDNYIMGVKDIHPVFLNYNERNPINIKGNHIDGINTFLRLGSNAGPNVTESENITGALERVKFVDAARDNFTLPTGSPYQGIGLIEESANRNNRPFVSLIADQTVDFGAEAEIAVTAQDHDGDALRLEAFNLPGFASFRDTGNGKGVFTLRPQEGDFGRHYNVRVRVTDSHGTMNSESFTIRVTDPYAYIASASSTLGPNIAENTLDGNLSTRWASASDSASWISYDLREDKLVTSVDISFDGTAPASAFDIEVSGDNAAWTKVYSATAPGVSAGSFAFEEVRARYLRIVTHEGASIAEVAIQCSPAPVIHTFKSSDDIFVVDGTKIYDTPTLRSRGKTRKSYVQFHVNGLQVEKSPVMSAELKLMATEPGYGRLTVYLADTTIWSEGDVSRWNIPKAIAIAQTREGQFTAGTVYSLDVTALITGNRSYTFILVYEKSKAGISFSSSEGVFHPTLLIETLRGGKPTAGARSLTLLMEHVPEGPLSPKEEPRLFPNPAASNVSLALDPLHTGTTTVAIYDQEGRQFMMRTLENNGDPFNFNLDALQLEPGLYFVRIVTEGEAPKVLRLIRE